MLRALFTGAPPQPMPHDSFVEAIQAEVLFLRGALCAANALVGRLAEQLAEAHSANNETLNCLGENMVEVARAASARATAESEAATAAEVAAVPETVNDAIKKVAAGNRKLAAELRDYAIGAIEDGEELETVIKNILNGEPVAEW